MSRNQTITPSGIARSFGDNEMIVSKTDLKGHIRYVNDVFIRVSAFPESELIGAPHNVIRHPDVPAGVFLLLWQTISAGKEIFSFLNNLARDGAHYWVFAHVTPSFDVSGRLVGYHSTRRTLPTELLPGIEKIYREVRDAERRIANAHQAAEAGLTLLTERLAEYGGYEQWVWSVAQSASRHHGVAHTAAQRQAGASWRAAA